MRHRRVVELARIVVLGLLQDGEDTGRGLEALLAGRAGRDADKDAVAIDEAALFRHRDDDGDGAFRRALWVPDELPRLRFLSSLGALAAAPTELLLRRRVAAKASPPR